MSTLGLYLHIPFCVKKCNYCDFLSFSAKEAQKDEYVKALAMEMRLWKDKVSNDVVDTIFIGGGTPSLLTEGQFDVLQNEMVKSFHLSDEMEYTIECNPGTVDAEKLKNYKKAGVLINSDEFSGIECNQAREKIIEFFEKNSLGQRVTNYKIRDWGVSRQRYWGAPIPMVRCEKCGIVPQNLANLPITLPDDIEITGEGNPLQMHPSWKNCLCPKCGKSAQKECDTLDTFFESLSEHAPLKTTFVVYQDAPLFTSAVCIRENDCRICSRKEKWYDLSRDGKKYQALSKDCQIMLFDKNPFCFAAEAKDVKCSYYRADFCYKPYNAAQVKMVMEKVMTFTDVAGAAKGNINNRKI